MNNILKIAVLFLPVCTVFIYTSNPSFGNEKSYSAEYIKSLYIIRLSQFVYWEHSPEIYDICVVGSDELGATLVQVAFRLDLEKTLNIKQKTMVSDFYECEILYVSRYSELELSQILFKTSTHPILSVSDIKKFVYQGGIIGMTVDGNVIKLSINNSLAKKHQLRIDSKLLEIATEIR